MLSIPSMLLPIHSILILIPSILLTIPSICLPIPWFWSRFLRICPPFLQFYSSLNAPLHSSYYSTGLNISYFDPEASSFREPTSLWNSSNVGRLDLGVHVSLPNNLDTGLGADCNIVLFAEGPTILSYQTPAPWFTPTWSFMIIRTIKTQQTSPVVVT